MRILVCMHYTGNLVLVIQYSHPVHQVLPIQCEHVIVIQYSHPVHQVLPIQCEHVIVYEHYNTVRVLKFHQTKASSCLSLRKNAAKLSSFEE